MNKSDERLTVIIIMNRAFWKKRYNSSSQLLQQPSLGSKESGTVTVFRKYWGKEFHGFPWPFHSKSEADDCFSLESLRSENIFFIHTFDGWVFVFKRIEMVSSENSQNFHKYTVAIRGKNWQNLSKNIDSASNFSRRFTLAATRDQLRKQPSSKKSYLWF